jgi:hypothetical protein
MSLDKLLAQIRTERPDIDTERASRLSSRVSTPGSEGKIKLLDPVTVHKGQRVTKYRSIEEMVAEYRVNDTLARKDTSSDPRK